MKKVQTSGLILIRSLPSYVQAFEVILFRYPSIFQPMEVVNGSVSKRFATIREENMIGKALCHQLEPLALFAAMIYTELFYFRNSNPSAFYTCNLVNLQGVWAFEKVACLIRVASIQGAGVTFSKAHTLYRDLMARGACKTKTKMSGDGCFCLPNISG